MSSRLAIPPGTLPWLGAAALLVFLQFWWLPGQQHAPRDSWSNRASGKLALVRLLERLFPDGMIRRESTNLVPDYPCVLVIVDPLFNPSPRERQSLAAWVDNGGVLVFAPQRDDPELSWQELDFEIDSLGIAPASAGDAPPDSGGKESGEETGDREKESSRESQNPFAESGLFTATTLEELGATSRLMDGPIVWKTEARLTIDRRRRHEKLLVDSDKRVHVASIRAGDGRVIACSSGEVFTNQALCEPREAELAVRIIDTARQAFERLNGYEGELVVSEFLNASRVGDTWAILLGPALRAGTLQLVLVALLIAWAGFQRFGPALQLQSTARKSLADSARALGNLQYRTGHSGPVVAQYADYVLARLRRSTGSHHGPRIEESLAARSGLPVDEVHRQLQNVEATIKSPQATPASSARAIRSLAALVGRASHRAVAVRKKR